LVWDINVLVAYQNGRQLFLATLTAKDALDVKTYAAAWISGRGYQRSLRRQKVQKIDDFLNKNKGYLPTAVLVGIRDPGVDFEATKGTKGQAGILHVPDNATLYIIDGQHRIEGLRSAQLTDSKNMELAKFSFPAVFVCPTIWDKNINAEVEEGKQFVIVNKTQTGVRGDLVDAFVYSLSLTSLGQPKPDLSGLPEDMKKAIKPTTDARNITLILKSSPAWQGKINKPNEPRGKMLIGEKTMIDALKLYILSQPQYQGVAIGPLAIALAQYWSAVLSFYPQAVSNPKDYWVQKGLGVAVFTMMFPSVDKLAAGKTTADYLAILQKKAKMPVAVFWGKGGQAQSMGTSYGSRKTLSGQIWP
jgi:DGQHR domain-containing protein